MFWKAIGFSLLVTLCFNCYSEPPTPIAPSPEPLPEVAVDDASSDERISITYSDIPVTVLETVIEDHEESRWAFASVSIATDTAPENNFFINLSDLLYRDYFSQNEFVAISFYSPFENPYSLPYCTVEYISDGHRKRTDISDPAAWNPSEFSAQEAQRYFPVVGEVSSTQYWFDATVTRCGYRQFEVDIHSNLRGFTTISTSLARKGLNPNDTFIGTDFQRVKMWGGRVSTLVDGTFATFPYQTDLPPGEYWLGIRFYPNWQENTEIADILGVSETIEEDVSVIIE